MEKQLHMNLMALTPLQGGALAEQAFALYRTQALFSPAVSCTLNAGTSQRIRSAKYGIHPRSFFLYEILISLKASAESVNSKESAAAAGQEPMRLHAIIWLKNLFAVMSLF